MELLVGNFIGYIFRMMVLGIYWFLIYMQVNYSINVEVMFINSIFILKWNYGIYFLRLS